MAGFQIIDAGGCVVTAALHAGHELRDSLRPWCLLDPATRMREEDPYTDRIAGIGTSMLVACRSRFEVDLNRPRSGAIYRLPADSWGLEVWPGEFPDAEVERSLDLYDRFYREAAGLLDGVVAAHGGAVVFDVHSYNHHRTGPGSPPDDPAANPELNIGTGTLDHSLWGGLVSRVAAHFRAVGLDVRENVRFRGGHFASWAHERYGGRVAVLALEFKKTFCDEWTGEVDPAVVERLRSLLAGCVPLAEEAVEEGRP